MFYWIAPERPLKIESLWQWAQALTGNLHPDLEPRPDTIAGSTALIDYGLFQFLGCDLTLHDQTLSLTTNWNRASSVSNVMLSMHFVLSRLGKEMYVTQPLDADVVNTILPPWFYMGDARGEVWLRVLDASDRLILPQHSLQPEIEGWFHVCN